MFGEPDCIAYKTAGLSVRNDMAIAIIYASYESLIRHNGNQKFKMLGQLLPP